MPHDGQAERFRPPNRRLTGCLDPDRRRKLEELVRRPGGPGFEPDDDVPGGGTERERQPNTSLEPGEQHKREQAGGTGSPVSIVVE
jgi:hypothetical protein